MSYTKTNWQNLPSTATPINATNLNKMENGIADANGAIGADAYSSSATYAVGDICIYGNKLYRCTTAISTAEAWNSNHWTEINLLDNTVLITSESNNIVTGLNKRIDNSCIKKHMVNAFLDTSTTVTTNSDQFAKIPLNNSIVVGTKLNFDSTNKCIAIGAGVTKVLVRAFMAYTENGESSLRGICIRKNNGSDIYQVLQTQKNQNGAYSFISMGDIIIDVVENDKIFMDVRTVAQPNQSVNISYNAYGASTHLFVEVIE